MGVRSPGEIYSLLVAENARRLQERFVRRESFAQQREVYTSVNDASQPFRIRIGEIDYDVDPAVFQQAAFAPWAEVAAILRRVQIANAARWAGVME